MKVQIDFTNGQDSITTNRTSGTTFVMIGLHWLGEMKKSRVMMMVRELLRRSILLNNFVDISEDFGYIIKVGNKNEINERDNKS